MRLDELPTSDNIEDRRGEQGGGGGGGGFGLGSGGLGIGTLVVLGLIGWATGIDPRLLIGGAEMLSSHNQSAEPPIRTRPNRTGSPNDQMGQFVAKALGSTEVVWKDIFAQSGRQYQAPVLVLFSGSTTSRGNDCGGARAATGPFYCPNDRKIYLDTSFFRDIERRFRGCEGQACKFSQAYVLAHEVGHHVQNLLGILPKAQQMQRGVSRTEGNQIQVRVELQADCLGGVWAYHSQERWKVIEPGDVEAALQTASAIGDDRLQKQAQGTVVPDSFTHGSSAQRMRWFQVGLKNGTVASCNTFDASARL